MGTTVGAEESCGHRRIGDSLLKLMALSMGTIGRPMY